MAHLGGVNLHQRDESHRDFGTSPAIRGGFQSVRSSLDGHDLSRFRQSRDDVWMLRRASDPHRMGIASDDVGEEHQDIDARNRNRPTHLDMRSNDWEDSWKNSTIVVRSNRDRNAIQPRSQCDRAAIVAHLERSWHMVMSWLMAHDPRAIVAINPTSRPDQTAAKIEQKFPLKRRCIPPYFLNFWLIREEIKQIWRKSKVLRDPLMFKLNCKAIGAGLMANFLLISSNFSLEFRTSARKKSRKFALIHVNWSLILAEIRLVVRFDWSSSGNLSFY